MTEKITELESKKDELESRLEAVQKEMDEFDISERVDEDDFDEYLNESHEQVHVCGMAYLPAYVLKEVDPTAYRCAFNDYVDEFSPEDFDEFQDLVTEREDLFSELEDVNGELEELNE